MHDLHSKEIRDVHARNIVKVDESYGLVNGGLIGQMTHGRTNALNTGPFKGSTLYSGSTFDQTLQS